MRTTLSSLLLLLLFLSGCAHLQPNYALSMEGCAWRLAGAITKNLTPAYLASTTLVAAPVEAVSLLPGKFGLAMQEIMIGAMSQAGAHIAEVQLRKSPYISTDQGLTSLSRDPTKLRDEYKAAMILVSTYVVRPRDIVITSRLVALANNDIMTSATTTLRRTDAVNELLQHKAGEKVYER